MKKGSFRKKTVSIQLYSSFYLALKNRHMLNLFLRNFLKLPMVSRKIIPKLYDTIRDIARTACHICYSGGNSKIPLDVGQGHTHRTRGIDTIIEELRTSRGRHQMFAN